MKVKNTKTDLKSHEIQFGVIRKQEDGRLVIEETDKEGNYLDSIDVEKLFEQYAELEYIKLKIEYKHEEEQ